MRLGYMVLPTALIETFTNAKRVTDRHAATGVQRALSKLLEEGSYDRHVRRIRRLQQARQRALLQALDRHLGGEVEVQGAASGLHVVVWFRSLPATAERALVGSARQQSVRVYPISQLFNPSKTRPAEQRSAGLVMGYALLDLDSIEEGVRRLADALRDVRG